MIELRPLTHLDFDSLQRVITGYTSNAKYAISKSETPALTVISAELVQLDQPYVKQFGPPDEEMFQRYRRVLADGLSFGGYDDERLIGLALAEPQWWNKSLWVWEFHVAEAYRGQGVGRRLMDALAEKAKAVGLRAIVCETQNTNVPAITFYRRVGFVLEGIDLSYYTNDDVSYGEVAFFMKRRLDYTRPISDF